MTPALKALLCLCPVAPLSLAHPAIRHTVAHHVAAFAHRYEAPTRAPSPPLDCGIGAAAGLGVTDSIANAGGMGGPVTLSPMPLAIIPSVIESAPSISFPAGSASAPYVGGGAVPPYGWRPTAPVTVMPVSGVPEVAAWVMMLTGFGAVGWRLRVARTRRTRFCGCRNYRC